jgi:hypothetical protein
MRRIIAFSGRHRLEPDPNAQAGLPQKRPKINIDAPFDREHRPFDREHRKTAARPASCRGRHAAVGHAFEPIPRLDS